MPPPILANFWKNADLKLVFIKSLEFLIFVKIYVMSKNIVDILGKDADKLLNHVCKTITKEQIHCPSASHVDEIWMNSNRSNQTLKSIQ